MNETAVPGLSRAQQVDEHRDVYKMPKQVNTRLKPNTNSACCDM